MSRYDLKKSDQPPYDWVCADTHYNIVIQWVQGEFNDSQKVTLLEDMEANVSILAKLMREMGDWLVDNHPDKL